VRFKKYIANGKHILQVSQSKIGIGRRFPNCFVSNASSSNPFLALIAEYVDFASWANLCALSELPKFKTLLHMVCNIQYGGRVTNDYDRELLDKHGAKFYDNKEYQFHTNYYYPDLTKVKNTAKSSAKGASSELLFICS
jgi:hypothetical protein